MTNFFERQDAARRNTFKLLLLFCASLLATCTAVYGAVFFAVFHEPIMTNWLLSWSYGDSYTSGMTWWNPVIFWVSAVGTVFVVGGGSLYKIRQLARGGGSLVCEQLGGRFMDFRTTNPDEQRLINVVEEMTIASGASMPLLYVLDHEEGINAFAAGFSTNNAAVAVSKGALRALDRDELQGVVAHEFSHIINGDMRINIRIIGVLHGLMMLSVAGHGLLRAGSVDLAARSRSRRGGRANLHLLILGAALCVVGYLGRVCGRMIQSAISRQREYLADAAAVQFTRNPEGLAGALKKIGGYSEGASIDAPMADQMGHMFFGDTLAKTGLLDRLFATHPPLTDRIRRLEPSFAGAFPEYTPPGLASELTDGELQRQKGVVAADGPIGPIEVEGLDWGSPEEEVIDSYAAGTMRVDPVDAVAQVGNPSAEHVEHARNLLEAMPAALRSQAREPYAAASVVFALLIDSDERATDHQLEVIDRKLTRELREKTRRNMERTRQLAPAARLPLLEVSISGLRRMSPAQFESFRGIVRQLIEADDRVTLFEFCLEQILLHRLEEAFDEESRGSKTRYWAITPIFEDVELLLSVLAHAGHDDPKGAQSAFENATGHSENERLKAKARLYPEEECSFDDLEGALDRIGAASDPVKQIVVDAAAHCALADETVTVEEAELLRAVCEIIDAPLPPFLPAAN